MSWNEHLAEESGFVFREVDDAWREAGIDEGNWLEIDLGEVSLPLVGAAGTTDASAFPSGTRGLVTSSPERAPR
jgi:hypothetical protein